MKFQRRSANHFSFLNSYTFGRAIDLNSDNDGTVTLTNIFDPEYNRGPADYDVTHTFSSNWIYELPWGRSGRGAAGSSAASSICASGIPVQITQAQSMLSTGITNNRPNKICDPVLSNPTIDMWFNTACFQQVADTTGTFGNTGRNTVRGPGPVQHRHVAHQEHEDRARSSRNCGSRCSTCSTTRSSRTRTGQLGNARVRHDLVDAGEPVVRDVRHDRAANAARR